MRYLAIFIPAIEGGYTVVFPDLPEIVTEGETLNDAMDMAEDALGDTISDYITEGYTLPHPSSVEDISKIVPKEMSGRGGDSSRSPLIQLVCVHLPSQSESFVCSA